MALPALQDRADDTDPFARYGHKWAIDLLTERYTAELKANRAFFDGDHWQNGDAWLGPKPDPNARDAREVLKLIESNFISKNVIREVIQRHTSAVVGREIAWKFIREDGEDGEQDTAITELESALTTWWDDRNIAEQFAQAVDTLLWAQRSTLRLFIPGRFLDQNGNLPRAKFQDALGYIHIDHPTPDMAAVHRDVNEGIMVGIYAWQNDDNETVVELAFLDERERLVIRQLTDDDDEPIDSTPIDTRGNLSMYEMRRSEYITDQIRRNQALVNMAITMMSRNVVLGGFLERTIVNAEMPGHYENDSDGQKRFVPDPLQVGPGVTNLLQGALVEDENGRRTIAPVNVIYRDPVPVQVFEETKQSAQENIYDETKQRHILIAGDATASGVSRQQATADFDTDVARTKVIVDRAAAWLLNTVKELAATLSATSERYAPYKAVADTRVRTAPPTADEQRVAIDLRDSQIISTETAMNRAGIEDVDAERQKIEQERDTDLERRRERLPAGQIPPGSEQGDSEGDQDDEE